eukprot:tig00000405_g430.t1
MLGGAGQGRAYGWGAGKAVALRVGVKSREAVADLGAAAESNAIPAGEHRKRAHHRPALCKQGLERPWNGTAGEPAVSPPCASRRGGGGLGPRKGVADLGAVVGP